VVQSAPSGSFTFAISAYSLAGGADVLTVNYAGDSLYASASGSSTINVTRSTFVLTATDLTVTAGASTNNASHVTVRPAGSYTGTVTLSAAVTSSAAGATSAPTFTGSSVTITSGPATGFITVAKTAAPSARRGPLARTNGWFGAAMTTTPAALVCFFLPGGRRRTKAGFVVVLLFVSASLFGIGCSGGSKKTPTVTVTPSRCSIKPTDALSLSVTVMGAGSVTPTGTVTLSSGKFSTSGNLSSGSTTLSIPANTLAAGKSNTLSVSYAGDRHYLAATGSASVSVLAPGTTPGSYTVTVTGTGNDAGTSVATTTFTLTVN
jgi:hypothetical protein